MARVQCPHCGWELETQKDAGDLTCSVCGGEVHPITLQEWLTDMLESSVSGAREALSESASVMLSTSSGSGSRSLSSSSLNRVARARPGKLYYGLVIVAAIVSVWCVSAALMLVLGGIASITDVALVLGLVAGALALLYQASRS